MILRRVTKHVKDQNWFAVGIDFCIVVIGVFIGIQVANWNDERQDRTDEAYFLENLHADITRVLAQSARTEAIRVDQAANLESAVNLIFSESRTRDISQIECEAVAYSFTTYVGRSRLPSLIQLQTAGRTGIITDRELARQLAELTQRQDALDTAIREIPLIHILTKYPDIFPTDTALEPAAGSEALERDGNTQCELSDILANRALLNDIVLNADAYDAFMRDGFVPWVDQLRQVKDRVDILVGADERDND